MKNAQEVVDEVLLNVGYAAKIDNVPDAMKLIMETATNDRRLIIKALLHRMHELGFLEGLRQVSQNMITWHDPKEKPEEEKTVMLLIKVPETAIYWIRGWWQIGKWWSCEEELEILAGEVVKWGSFELPEIEEVEG